MSRHSRHGRHPQSNTAAQPSRHASADRPVAATATAPLADLPLDLAAPARRAIEMSVPDLPEPETAKPEAQPTPEPAHARAGAFDAATGVPSSVVPSSAAPVPTGDADAIRGPEPDPARTTCTQAQLRRFIKSRPWIPMHELRRRFGIWGGDDDVTPVRMGSATIFVGLPSTEGRMLGELLNAGDVGFELSLDPGAPIVVGVYPMRPVPRS